MKKYLLLGLILVVAACTASSNPETGMDVEFDIPFQKKDWAKLDYEDAANSRDFCVVTTGRNGIKVILRKDEGNNKIVKAVKSTRNILPGATFRLAVNKHVYRTGSEFFPMSLTGKIIRDLKQADKAYLEWREPNSGRFGVLRHNTIVKLNQFAVLYEACVTELK